MSDARVWGMRDTGADLRRERQPRRAFHNSRVPNDKWCGGTEPHHSAPSARVLFVRDNRCVGTVGGNIRVPTRVDLPQRSGGTFVSTVATLEWGQRMLQ